MRVAVCNTVAAVVANIHSADNKGYDCTMSTEIAEDERIDTVGYFLVDTADNIGTEVYSAAAGITRILRKYCTGLNIPVQY